MNWKSMSPLLRGIPALPGARCKGQADLFEATVGRQISAPTRDARDALKAERETARTIALRICHSCPSLAACRGWVDGLPTTRRPRGVVGGEVVRSDGRVVGGST